MSHLLQSAHLCVCFSSWACILSLLNVLSMMSLRESPAASPTKPVACESVGLWCSYTLSRSPPPVLNPGKRGQYSEVTVIHLGLSLPLFASEFPMSVSTLLNLSLAVFLLVLTPGTHQAAPASTMVWPLPGYGCSCCAPTEGRCSHRWRGQPPRPHTGVLWTG